MELLQQMQQLGFSQYEAQAYIALLQSNPVNGYELAKTSGIPRPNIYHVLQKLEEHGAVLKMDTPEGARYKPVLPDELLEKLKMNYQTTLDAASFGLQQVTSAPTVEYILNLRGYAPMMDHARTLLNQAKHSLLISIWPKESMALADMVKQAQERGVEITTLCLQGCPKPCPACQGHVFRYPIAPKEGGRWMLLVADNLELLAGEITPTGDAISVRTRQSMLVNLTSGYIQNSIALASILTGLTGPLDSMLDPQSIDALKTLHPLQSQGQWLKVLQQALHLGGASIEI